MLHLTHGDMACQRLDAAGIGGIKASWDDNLHEGPVPEGLDLDALNAVRADFLAGCGYGDRGEIAGRLRGRTELLRAAAASGEVCVWTTPELYDQLHLWQILDWFAGEGRKAPPPLLATVDCLFSEATTEVLTSSLAAAQPASAEALAAASELWARFRAPDPRRLATFDAARAPLPRLEQGLLRLFEEYPDLSTGLCRSQRQMLAVLGGEPQGPGALFRACQALEETPFMGDWSFWRLLAALLEGREPAVRRIEGAPLAFPPATDPGSDQFRRQRFGVTAIGAALIAGETDFIAANGIDRWLGGVHLTTDGHWRWDPREGRLWPTPGP